MFVKFPEVGVTPEYDSGIIPPFPKGIKGIVVKESQGLHSLCTTSWGDGVGKKVPSILIPSSHLDVPSEGMGYTCVNCKYLTIQSQARDIKSTKEDFVHFQFYIARNKSEHSVHYKLIPRIYGGFSPLCRTTHDRVKVMTTSSPPLGGNTLY